MLPPALWAVMLGFGTPQDPPNPGPPQDLTSLTIEELMQVEITRRELNGPMEKDSFHIDLPEGQRFVDVMDHPPAAAQIRQLLDQAKTKSEQAGEAGKK